MEKIISPQRAEKAAGQELALLLESLVVEGEESLFEFDSVELKSKLEELISVKRVTKEFFSDVHKAAEETPSWLTSKSRWNSVLSALNGLVEPDPIQGEGGEDDENEDPVSEQPDESADDTDDNSGAGLVNRLTDEFSAKDQVDNFLLKTLPGIPIIGLPFKFAIFLFELGKRLWAAFLAVLDAVIRRMDTEENVVWSLRQVSSYWRPLGWLVMIFATIVAYGHWILFGLIVPIIKFATDPLGRFAKFLRRRSGKGESDSETDDELPPTN